MNLLESLLLFNWGKLASIYVTVYRKTGHNVACVRKYREKIDQFLKNVLFQAKGNG